MTSARRVTLGEQLEDELRRLRLVLAREIDWLRHRLGRPPLTGLGSTVIGDEQARAAIAGPDTVGRREFLHAHSACRAINSLTRQLKERALSTRAAGTPFPIDSLCDGFGLDAFQRHVLLLALAPELDTEFGRLFAYAQDDAAARHVTPALAMATFDDASTLRVSDVLRPADPLFRLALLRDGSPEPGYANKPLWLESRVSWYLQGVDDRRPTGTLSMRAVDQSASPKEYRALAEAVRAALARNSAGSTVPVINLIGADERHALNCASAIAADLGCALHMPTVAAGGTVPIAELDRESVLRKTAYLLETGENDPDAPTVELVESTRSVVLLASRHPVRLARPTIVITVPSLTSKARREMWARSLGSDTAADDSSLDAIVHHFDLDPGGVDRVTAAARGAARLRGESMTGEDIWQACREYGRRRLGGLADRRETSFGWDDIVLPLDARTQLAEIAHQVQHRSTVFDDWHFGDRITRGRGITALFAGSSGTGKTMAAEILARELKLDLYRIDLSGVVDKFIGETEKNLKRIFAAAEEGGAILFFDEADALFGKRTEVRDSHDRYANIEVNYLLQRMEDYAGLAILATNRKSALDRAFLRRLKFLVDFPFPATDSRLRIWQKVLPAEAPVNGIDFGALARLDLSGGNIQSMALNAAFLAAGDGRVITMDHLRHAAQREYSKLDKTPSPSDFAALRKVGA